RDFHVTGVQTCALPILAEPANLVGVLALGSSIAWPLLRHRRAILGVQVLGSLLFGLHYLLLGAAAMCVMGAVQGVALVVLIDRRIGRAWCREGGEVAVG